MTEEHYKSLNLGNVCIFPNVYLDSGRICDTCKVRTNCKCEAKRFFTSTPKNRKVVSKTGEIENV